MLAPRHILILALAILAACRTGAHESPGPGSPPAASTTRPAPITVASVSTPTAASSDPPPRPFVVRNLGAGAVEVRNNGDALLRVAFELDIERDVSGRWESTHISNMLMQTKCFDPRPADGCVNIAPHQAIRPLPWRGWFGCTQCLTCRANVPATPGRYRVVARTCDGGARAESEPIVVVRDGEVEGAPRQ